MHTHSAEEVAFIYSGTAELVVGRGRAIVTRGGLALIPAMAPHDVYNVGEETVTMVNFFPTAVFVTTFEERLSPIGAWSFVIGAPQELTPEHVT